MKKRCVKSFIMISQSAFFSFFLVEVWSHLGGWGGGGGGNRHPFYPNIIISGSIKCLNKYNSRNFSQDKVPFLKIKIVVVKFKRSFFPKVAFSEYAVLCNYVCNTRPSRVTTMFAIPTPYV